MQASTPMGKPWLYPTATNHWGRAEHAAIDRVLDSGQFTFGKEVAAFEAEFAAYHGRKHCITVNSGSSANLIAVESLFYVRNRPLIRGDRALVPGLAWSTTWAPLIQKGLDLTLMDAGDDWNAIVPRETPELLVLCPLLGNPILYDDWHAASELTQTYVIVDCCESVGASDGYCKMGSFGTLATYSYYFGHQLSAVEGGAILTDSDELAYICRLLRSHGWTRGLKPAEDLADEYRFEIPGYNVRWTELYAAIAREQLRKVDAGATARLVNADYLQELLESCDNRIKWPVLRGSPNPFGIAFELESPEIRQKVAQALRSAGIDCRPPAGGSLRLQPMGAAWTDQETPNADRIHRSGLVIGNAPFPIPEKVEKAAAVIRRLLG